MCVNSFSLERIRDEFAFAAYRTHGSHFKARPLGAPGMFEPTTPWFRR